MFFIAPSPSGKAPDSDSGIGGSNPSGAAKHRRSDRKIGPFLLPVPHADDPNLCTAFDPPAEAAPCIRPLPTPELRNSPNHRHLSEIGQLPRAGAPPCRAGMSPTVSHARTDVDTQHVTGTNSRPCHTKTPIRAPATDLGAPGAAIRAVALPRTPTRIPASTTAKRQKPGNAGLLKQSSQQAGTQQTRWISAWRTGSRDGPCADRPSYARLHGRRGS